LVAEKAAHGRLFAFLGSDTIFGLPEYMLWSIIRFFALHFLVLRKGVHPAPGLIVFEGTLI